MRFFFGVTFLTRFFSLSRSKIEVYYMSSNPAAVLARQRQPQFTRSKKNICGARTHDLQLDKLLGAVILSLKKEYLWGSNPRSAAR